MLTADNKGLRDDSPAGRQMIKDLCDKIVSESPFKVRGTYKNTKGQVIINVIDPREDDTDRFQPFVVRDEAEWQERRPEHKAVGS